MCLDAGSLQTGSVGHCFGFAHSESASNRQGAIDMHDVRTSKQLGTEHRSSVTHATADQVINQYQLASCRSHFFHHLNGIDFVEMVQEQRADDGVEILRQGFIQNVELHELNTRPISNGLLSGDIQRGRTDVRSRKLHRQSAALRAEAESDRNIATPAGQIQNSQLASGRLSLECRSPQTGPEDGRTATPAVDTREPLESLSMLMFIKAGLVHQFRLAPARSEGFEHLFDRGVDAAS